ncbi:MAG: large conductance mechanosensitive channel protein MscL [Candidatus Izimaplasma sp.]|nr:large conductance mechanosensitive channel protein MscL [Candidatus Izimaplasma bacterium]
MKNLAKEFKTFIQKGNILDLAVAVVIGTAFTRIVNSLVKDIITPVISLVTGEQGFKNYKYVITAANETAGIQENAIYYGSFIQNIIDFFVIAIIVFLVVRFINNAKDMFDKAEEELKTQIINQKVKTDQVLLDIKDLLKENLN